MVPVFSILANDFSHSMRSGKFFFFEISLDKLVFANYNIGKELAVANHIRKELCSMMIHPFVQFGGALIGGLVTLGLFVYNIASLFIGSRNCSCAGCSIK